MCTCAASFAVAALLLAPLGSCRNLSNDVFAPRTISRQRDSTSLDCVSEFGQLTDASWFLPLQSDAGTTVAQNVAGFADCVALCQAGSDCQLVTYDYMAKTCTVRNGTTPEFTGCVTAAGHSL